MKTNTKNTPTPLEPFRHPDETAIVYLRRLVASMNYEHEYLLDALPSVEAVMEYFGLFKTYDTEYLDNGILASIIEGDDPKPLQDFIAKYNLPWDISYTLEQRAAYAQAQAEDRQAVEG
jgi:hypothetical protein